MSANEAGEQSPSETSGRETGAPAGDRAPEQAVSDSGRPSVLPDTTVGEQPSPPAATDRGPEASSDRGSRPTSSDTMASALRNTKAKANDARAGDDPAADFVRTTDDLRRTGTRRGTQAEFGAATAFERFAADVRREAGSRPERTPHPTLGSTRRRASADTGRTSASHRNDSERVTPSDDRHSARHQPEVDAAHHSDSARAATQTDRTGHHRPRQGSEAAERERGDSGTSTDRARQAASSDSVIEVSIPLAAGDNALWEAVDHGGDVSTALFARAAGQALAARGITVDISELETLLDPLTDVTVSSLRDDPGSGSLGSTATSDKLRSMLSTARERGDTSIEYATTLHSVDGVIELLVASRVDQLSSAAVTSLESGGSIARDDKGNSLLTRTNGDQVYTDAQGSTFTKQLGGLWQPPDQSEGVWATIEKDASKLSGGLSTISKLAEVAGETDVSKWIGRAAAGLKLFGDGSALEKSESALSFAEMAKLSESEHLWQQALGKGLGLFESKLGVIGGLMALQDAHDDPMGAAAGALSAAYSFLGGIDTAVSAGGSAEFGVLTLSGGNSTVAAVSAGEALVLLGGGLVALAWVMGDSTFEGERTAERDAQEAGNFLGIAASLADASPGWVRSNLWRPWGTEDAFHLGNPDTRGHFNAGLDHGYLKAQALSSALRKDLLTTVRRFALTHGGGELAPIRATFDSVNDYAHYLQQFVRAMPHPKPDRPSPPVGQFLYH